MKSLQEWEDRQAVEKSEGEFQQRVLAASYGPHDPKLFWRIFDPTAVPGEEEMPGGGHIIQPNSIEEFEAMLEEWDAEGALEAMTAITMGGPELEKMFKQSPEYPADYKSPTNILPV